MSVIMNDVLLCTSLRISRECLYWVTYPEWIPVERSFQDDKCRILQKVDNSPQKSTEAIKFTIVDIRKPEQKLKMSSLHPTMHSTVIMLLIALQ